MYIDLKVCDILIKAHGNDIFTIADEFNVSGIVMHEILVALYLEAKVIDKDYKFIYTPFSKKLTEQFVSRRINKINISNKISKIAIKENLLECKEDYYVLTDKSIDILKAYASMQLK